MFGVEIEFADAITSDVKNTIKPLVSKPVRHTTRADNIASKGDTWDIKWEASISVQSSCHGKRTLYGGEICTPALVPGKQAFKEIRRVIESIQGLNPRARFHKTTGLHVHTNFEGANEMVFMALWYGIYDEVDVLFPGRRKTAYAQSALRRRDVNNKRNSARLGKFLQRYWENSSKGDELRFYDRKKVPFVEFRVGRMYDDPQFTTGWTKICLGLVEMAKTVSMREVDELNILAKLYKNKKCPDLSLSSKEIEALGLYD